MLSYEDRIRDEHIFLLCCNLNLLIEAWEKWDGMASIFVNGRCVDERSLVWALTDLGYEVVI